MRVEADFKDKKERDDSRLHMEAFKTLIDRITFPYVRLRSSGIRMDSLKCVRKFRTHAQERLDQVSGE